MVTFDVPSDRARRQLTRRLERHGPRVLYSVFTITASPIQVDRLLAGSVDLVGGSGHLLALPYCPDCDVVGVGADLEILSEAGWVV